jgi:MarR family transcriptional regulator, transcriptional regulator for hemolysin
VIIHLGHHTETGVVLGPNQNRAKETPLDKYEIQHNFGFLVNDLTRLITSEFNDLMSPIDLTRSQWRVIVYLHREDGLSQSELAELLSVGKVTIGGLVDRLEHAGWIERRDDANDRRTKRAYLTQKGKAIESEMTKKGGELTRRILRSLSSDEQQTLIDMLLAVKEDLVQMKEERQSNDPSKVLPLKRKLKEP